MSNYAKLLNNLSTLKLFRIKDKLDEYIDLINTNKKNIVDSCLLYTSDAADE